MSLLGPDDFELDGKKRKKKLAKDLSPAHQKMIEKWLDDMDDPGLFERLAELVGPDEARRRIAQRKLQRKKLAREDLLEE